MELNNKKKVKKQQLAEYTEKREKSFANLELKKKMDVEISDNRNKANKFFSKQNSISKKVKAIQRKSSVFSTNEEESEDMDLQKYLFAKSSKLRNTIASAGETENGEKINKRRILLHKTIKASPARNKSELNSDHSLDSETSPTNPNLEEREKLGILQFKRLRNSNIL
jgi:hypothetical protein